MSAGFHPHHSNVAPQAAYPAQHQYPQQYAAEQYHQVPQHYAPQPQLSEHQCYQPQQPMYHQAKVSQCQCGDPYCQQSGAQYITPQVFQPAPQSHTGCIMPSQHVVPSPVVVPRVHKPAAMPASTPYTHSPYAQSTTSEPPSEQENYAPLQQYNGGTITDSSDKSSTRGSIAGHVDERHHGLSDDSDERDYNRNKMMMHDDRSDDQSVHTEKRQQQGGIINITVETINTSIGKVTTIAGSPHGSSFLQAALRQYPIEAFEVIYKEVAPVMGKLLLDKHACYVVKMVLEMMDKEEAIAHLDTIAVNEELLLTLCTKDLHSRRMIQFILDFTGTRGRYLFNLVMTRPMHIVRTQQGCITLQRILDHFPADDKEAYFTTVRGNFMEYALDPFGNYIIQYMLTEGNQVENSNTLALYCRGQLHNMVCHKYASNVIEKCFGLVTPELQHDIIEEMFNAPEPTLMRVLTDSSANYVVQAAIRAASFRDVTLVNNRIGAMLPHIQYGKKLQQRLVRRLKH